MVSCNYQDKRDTVENLNNKLNQKYIIESSKRGGYDVIKTNTFESLREISGYFQVSSVIEHSIRHGFEVFELPKAQYSGNHVFFISNFLQILRVET